MHTRLKMPKPPCCQLLIGQSPISQILIAPVPPKWWRRNKKGPAATTALFCFIREMTYSEDLQSKEISIPVVDFSSFTKGDPIARQECANKILEAFTTVGFVYLSNALPADTIDTAFSLSKEFFAKPQEEKMKVEWESFVGKRGFVVKGTPIPIFYYIKIDFGIRPRTDF